MKHKKCKIADLSIRGRMGYAITCFEAIIIFYKAQTPHAIVRREVTVTKSSRKRWHVSIRI